jgi:hypothetical protein
MSFVCFEMGETLSLEIMACERVVIRETLSPDSRLLCILKWGKETLSLEIVACVCVVKGETLSSESHILYVLKWGKR